MTKLLKISLLTLFVTAITSLAYWGAMSIPNYITLPQNALFEVRNNHGTYTEYHPNGSIKSVDNYKNGHRNGLSILFSANGDTLKSISYEDGFKSGFTKTYDSSGDLIKIENYGLGYLISDEVLNDSIYKYDLLSFETGKNVFSTNCNSCHTPNSLEENLKDKITSLDTIHTSLIDSALLDSNYFVNIPISDVDVLLDYVLEINEQSKPKPFPFLVFRKKHFKKI